MNVLVRQALLAVQVAALTGCASYPHAQTSASTARFLFPAGSEVRSPPEGPVELETPLRVGLAFVPAGDGPRGCCARGRGIAPDVRLELLERVQGAFEELSFVETLVVVPETFLDPAQGLAGLRRAAHAFGTDVIALLGYDQVQYTDTGPVLGILHLTIVGQVLVPAQKNETRTLMEASVFDVASGNLLLHARATDTDRSRSTLLRADARLRDDSTASFAAATEVLIGELDIQLEAFREAIREGRPVFGRRIAVSPAPGGAATAGAAGDAAAGDFGGGALGIALLLVLCAAGRRRGGTGGVASR